MQDVLIDKKMWDSHPVIHIRSMKIHDNSPVWWTMICWEVGFCQNLLGQIFNRDEGCPFHPLWNSKISGLVRWCQVTKDLQLKILVVFRQGDKNSPLNSWKKGFASLYIKHLSKIKPSITLPETNIGPKNDGGLFSGAMLVSGRVSGISNSKKQKLKQIVKQYAHLEAWQPWRHHPGWRWLAWFKHIALSNYISWVWGILPSKTFEATCLDMTLSHTSILLSC